MIIEKIVIEKKCQTRTGTEVKIEISEIQSAVKEQVSHETFL